MSQQNSEKGSKSGEEASEGNVTEQSGSSDREDPS
jgi:hypothetical protein